MIERLTSLFDERALEPELLRLIDDAQTGLVFTVVALLVAAGIGAVHAVGPGHGKLLIGAYLASTDGRHRDAVALGALVALMHTASVFALGVVFQLTQQVPGGDRLEPILSIVSAVAVIVVGVVVLRRQLRARRGGSGTGPGELVGARGPSARSVADHDHDDHHDDHGQGAHELRHDGHSHELPEGVAPLSRAGIVALATSGGLLPSPAAFLVLVTAMAIGRTAFGLALVTAFGVGLGVTLALLGSAVLWGRGALMSGRFASRGEGRSAAWVDRSVRLVPLLGALGVVLGGSVVLVVALARW